MNVLILIESDSATDVIDFDYFLASEKSIGSTNEVLSVMSDF